MERWPLFSWTDRESSLATMWYVPNGKHARCGTLVLTAVFLGQAGGQSRHKVRMSAFSGFLRNVEKEELFRPTLAVFLTHIRATFFPSSSFPLCIFWLRFTCISSTLCKACSDDFTFVRVADDDRIEFLLRTLLLRTQVCWEHSPKAGLPFRRRARSFCFACVYAMFLLNWVGLGSVWLVRALAGNLGVAGNCTSFSKHEKELGKFSLRVVFLFFWHLLEVCSDFSIRFTETKLS